MFSANNSAAEFFSSLDSETGLLSNKNDSENVGSILSNPNNDGGLDAFGGKDFFGNPDCSNMDENFFADASAETVGSLACASAETIGSLACNSAETIGSVACASVGSDAGASCGGGSFSSVC